MNEYFGNNTDTILQSRRERIHHEKGSPRSSQKAETGYDPDPSQIEWIPTSN